MPGNVGLSVNSGPVVPSKVMLFSQIVASFPPHEYEVGGGVHAVLTTLTPSPSVHHRVSGGYASRHVPKLPGEVLVIGTHIMSYAGVTRLLLWMSATTSTCCVATPLVCSLSGSVSPATAQCTCLARLLVCVCADLWLIGSRPLRSNPRSRQRAGRERAACVHPCASTGVQQLTFPVFIQ